MRIAAIISAGLATLALLGAAGASAAPSRASVSALVEGLDAHTTALSADRFALAAGPLLGETDGAVEQLPVRLWAGQDYVFAGAPDAACNTLNLRVIDPNGMVLAEAAGPAPRLHVRPLMTGRHIIEAATANRRAQTCWFAVNVYAR